MYFKLQITPLKTQFLCFKEQFFVCSPQKLLEAKLFSIQHALLYTTWDKQASNFDYRGLSYSS